MSHHAPHPFKPNKKPSWFVNTPSIFCLQYVICYRKFHFDIFGMVHRMVCTVPSALSTSIHLNSDCPATSAFSRRTFSAINKSFVLCTLLMRFVTDVFQPSAC